MTKNKMFITDEKTLYSSCQDKSSVSGKKSAEKSKPFSRSSKSTNCEFYSNSSGSDLNTAVQRACGFVKRPEVPAWLYINAYRTMDAHGRALSLTTLKRSTLSVPNHGSHHPKESDIVKEQFEKYHDVHEERTNTNFEPNTTKLLTREVNHG